MLVAADAAAAMRRATQSAFDLAVIDVGLPDADGRDLCQALRARGLGAPVLFLTARDALTDRVVGLHGGRRRLRHQAVRVRRARRAPARAASPRGRAAPPAGAARQRRARSGRPRRRGPAGATELTPTEFRLLAALAGRDGAVVRRRDLVGAAWPDGAIVHDNTLDQYVARLRRKLREIAPERRSSRCAASATGSADAPPAHAAHPRHGAVVRSPRPSSSRCSWPRSTSSCACRWTATSSARCARRPPPPRRPPPSGTVASSCATRPTTRRSTATCGSTSAAARSCARPATPRCSARRTRSRGAPGRFARRPIAACACTASSCRRATAPSASVVVAESLEVYDRTTDVALVGSIALGGLLLVLVAGLTWIATGRALHPVREMTRTAADWSAHDHERRFGPDPRPDELGELAARSTRCWTASPRACATSSGCRAELSHELRTPLARISAETQLLRAAPAPPSEIERGPRGDRAERGRDERDPRHAHEGRARGGRPRPRSRRARPAAEAHRRRWRAAL